MRQDQSVIVKRLADCVKLQEEWIRAIPKSLQPLQNEFCI